MSSASKTCKTCWKCITNDYFRGMFFIAGFHMVKVSIFVGNKVHEFDVTGVLVQSIMPKSLFILLIQIYSSFVYFSLISWTVNIPKSWVFIHIGGWDLHSVFVIRKFDWIWEWFVGEKSIEDRYWCGDVNSTAWSSCW